MSAADIRDARQARIEQLKRIRESLGVRVGDDARTPLEDDRLLTVDEACEALDIGRRTFYRRIETLGGLTPVLIDGRSYVVYEQLIDFLQRYETLQRAKVDAALNAATTKRADENAA